MKIYTSTDTLPNNNFKALKDIKFKKTFKNMMDERNIISDTIESDKYIKKFCDKYDAIAIVDIDGYGHYRYEYQGNMKVYYSRTGLRGIMDKIKNMVSKNKRVIQICGEPSETIRSASNSLADNIKNYSFFFNRTTI